MRIGATVIPPDILLEVQYEAIVDDFEAQARRLVAPCGRIGSGCPEL